MTETPATNNWFVASVKMPEEILKDNMDNDFRQSFLELKVIWKDDDMFELRIKTSNGRYSGMTEVYDTSETLTDFAKALMGFPTDRKTLFYEIGEKDSYSYFSIRFYCICLVLQ